MIRMIAACTTLLLLFAPVGNAQSTSRAPDAADEALAVAREWWRAYAVGDTAYLNAHSSSEASFTLSVGKVSNRRQIIADVSNRNDSRKITIQWLDGAVHHPAPSLAVVTNTVNEGIGQSFATYRYLSVLEKSSGVWRVSHAQSTRVLELTPRIPTASAGRMDEFAGLYRTAAGGTIELAVRETALVLIDPQGGETRLEPIGPALFEASNVMGLGLLRFVFNRDARGRIESVSRLAANVVTFPRAE